MTAESHEDKTDCLRGEVSIVDHGDVVENGPQAKPWGVLLPTALATGLVRVPHRGGSCNVRAFFDGGSQRSFVARGLADRLELSDRGKCRLTLTGINTTVPFRWYDTVSLPLSMGGVSTTVTAIIRDDSIADIYTSGLQSAALML